MTTPLYPNRQYTCVCYVDIPDIVEHTSAGNTEARMRENIVANFNDQRAGGMGTSGARIVTVGEGAWLVTRNSTASDVLNFNLQFTTGERQITDIEVGSQILASINWHVRDRANVRPATGHWSAWEYMGGVLWNWALNDVPWGEHVVFDVQNGHTETQTNSSDSVVGRATNYVFNGNRQTSTDAARDGNTPGGNFAGDTINWTMIRTVVIGTGVVVAIIGAAVIVKTVRDAVT